MGLQYFNLFQSDDEVRSHGNLEVLRCYKTDLKNSDRKLLLCI